MVVHLLWLFLGEVALTELLRENGQNDFKVLQRFATEALSQGHHHGWTCLNGMELLG